MEKKNKKLQLNKETLRNLSDESLEQVAGGGRKDNTLGVICEVTKAKSACVNVSACHSVCIGWC